MAQTNFGICISKSFYCILKLVDIIIFIWLEIIFKMDGRFSVRNTLMSFSDVSSDVNIKSGCCACFKQAQNKNILFDVNLVGLVYFVFIIVFTKCKLATWNKLKLKLCKLNVYFLDFQTIYFSKGLKHEVGAFFLCLLMVLLIGYSSVAVRQHSVEEVRSSKLIKLQRY